VRWVDIEKWYEGDKENKIIKEEREERK